MITLMMMLTVISLFLFVCICWYRNKLLISTLILKEFFNAIKTLQMDRVLSLYHLLSHVILHECDVDVDVA